MGLPRPKRRQQAKRLHDNAPRVWQAFLMFILNAASSCRVDTKVHSLGQILVTVENISAQWMNGAAMRGWQWLMEEAASM